VCQGCEGVCGLWVLVEVIKNKYPENVKGIVGAVWELPAGWHSQSRPFPLKLGWIGCAIWQVAPGRLPRFFSYFRDVFFELFQ